MTTEKTHIVLWMQGSNLPAMLPVAEVREGAVTYTPKFSDRLLMTPGETKECLAKIRALYGEQDLAVVADNNGGWESVSKRDDMLPHWAFKLKQARGGSP